MEIPVKDIVEEELALLGYRKKAKNWYKQYDEVVHVVGLQTSDWGKYYFINLGVWVRKLAEKRYPRIPECHLQLRLNRVTGNPFELEAALDEEDYWKMDSEQRRHVIKLALCNAEFAFFRQLTNLEAVKQFVCSKRQTNLAVTKSLKHFLT